MVGRPRWKELKSCSFVVSVCVYVGVVVVVVLFVQRIDVGDQWCRGVDFFGCVVPYQVFLELRGGWVVCEWVDEWVEWWGVRSMRLRIK